MILTSSSPVSWLLALAAAVAYAVPAAAASRLGAAAARNALLVAWLLHGAVLVWGLWGDAPRFGFAPALSMTAWLVLTVYAVERQLFPQMQSRWVLAGLGAAAIVLVILGAQSYREGKVYRFDKETMTYSDADGSWATKWEDRSHERGKPNHLPGWTAGDTGSVLTPEPYQALEGPWINGVDPAAQ